MLCGPWMDTSNLWSVLDSISGLGNSGCCNKNPVDWVAETEVQDQGADRVGFWGWHHSWLVDSHFLSVPLHGEAEAALISSFACKSTNDLPKASLQSTITLGVGASTYESRQGTQKFSP